MTVAVIALFGVLPYIAAAEGGGASASTALALRPAASPWPDSALLMALMLALFAILFGTRQV